MKSILASAVLSTELFESLGTADIEKLEPELRQVELKGGDTLFHQGDIGDCFYVVVNGRLRALLEQPDGRETVLGEIGKGETAGEMALLTGETRSATVRAVRDTEMLALSKDGFNRLAETHPRMMMMLTRRIIERYWQALREGPPSASAVHTIALVGTSPEVRLPDFARRLAAALESAGSVRHLDHDELDRALGFGASQIPHDHARNPAIVAWLNEQESTYRFMLYQADATPSAWSRRCVRQADLVLLVGDGGKSPQLGPVEVGMTHLELGLASSKQLVLLHAERKPLYPGTSEWLARRHVDRHHHLVENSSGDFSRIVRFLTGTATGLVLGGGGARSFAQIGVLRALQEAGVTIDVVGGTSMGAFLAAECAMGWDAGRMLEYNRRIWRKRWPIRDYTFPYMGLIKGRRFQRILRETYDESQIEDLGLNFFCCSSNLTRAALTTHRSGTIWRALAASIAVPGLAPAIFENGDLLVDGAALDNLPIDVMRAQCNGVVLAVDVSPLVDLVVDSALSEPPSSWGLLFRRLLRREVRIPSILEILSRASSLASVQQVEQLKRQAHLYLHPPIEAYSIFDTARIDDLAALGYEYGQRAIAEWQRGASTRRTRRSRLTVV